MIPKQKSYIHVWLRGISCVRFDLLIQKELQVGLILIMRVPLFIMPIRMNGSIKM